MLKRNALKAKFCLEGISFYYNFLARKPSPPSICRQTGGSPLVSGKDASLSAKEGWKGG